MARKLPTGGALAAVAVAALLAAVLLDRLAPFPSAEVSRGSEEAFAQGLHLRELPPRQPPLRWTSGRASFRFLNLPPGPLRLEVRLHGHREPVQVAADGLLLGVLLPGAEAASFRLPPGQRRGVEVELVTEGFTAADGRHLGALLDRVTLIHERSGSPPVGLVLSLLVPAVAALFAGTLSGLARGWAVALALTALQALALWPCGLLRSPYAMRLAALLTIGIGLAVAFACWAGRRFEGATPGAFLALLAAFLLQGAAATSPVMVVSDAVFHANKLAGVARGDLFPTSLTQHAPPFRFPYGVSFYALLAPLARAGLDGVTLVRTGAAAAGLAASAGLFCLLAGGGARRAAAAVLALQLLPGAFDVYSFGNLSNVFGQAATAFFFAWWAGRARGGWPVGALLLAVGCLSHLSSLIVLTVLGLSLALARRREILRDRVRLPALAIGLGLAGVYYVSFAGLVLEQIGRLLEGGGPGGGASSAAAVLWMQGLRAVSQWGLPALLLAALGRPHPSRGGLDRDLTAFWGAGALLAVVGVATPLEVRYLYALTLPLAVAAADGFLELRGRGRAGRALAWALLGAQGALAARGVAEAVLARYRPPL